MPDLGQNELRELARALRESAMNDGLEPVVIKTEILEKAADDMDELVTTLTTALVAVSRLLMVGDSLIDHISDFAGCYCDDASKCGWCLRVDAWKSVRGY